MRALDDAPAFFRSLVLQPLSLQRDVHAWQAAWLRTEALPLDTEQRADVNAALHWLHERTQQITHKTLSLEVYLQMTQLERPAGPQRISKNASRWAPRIGLGVWPDREPPRSLTKEDFFNTPPEGKLRETTFHVMHIDDSKATGEVVREMAGSGALLSTLVEPETATADRKQVSAHLATHITEETFQGYRMYVPLLDGESIQTLDQAALEACLAGTSLYLREDLKENAILLLTRVPIAALVEGVFARQHPAEAHANLA